VVKHVKGMNRFVTSICKVTLVVIPSRLAHCLIHSISNRTLVNNLANCCC
jgi:hypothetical protein